MTLFFGILAFVVVLAVLVLVHELGHFTTAKLFGVRVDEFGLGFPPRVKGWRRGGTLYSLNAIPLGGFVKMAGENGDASEPDSFGAKPPWQRVLILVAGPAMNLLLALVVLTFTYSTGYPDGLTTITGVAAHSPAAAAGLRNGDKIVAVNGRHMAYRSDLITAIESQVQSRPGQPAALEVQRGGRVFTVRLVPRAHPPRNQGAVGIQLAVDTTVRYTPLSAAGHALHEEAAIVGALPSFFAQLPQHGTSGLAGPIGIAHATTDAVRAAPRAGPSPVLWLAALLTISLGSLNLLPFPALDGGRIVFVLLSWIRRRNVDPEVEGLIHMLGMAVLLVLIMVISYQDLAHWITGQPY